VVVVVVLAAAVVHKHRRRHEALPGSGTPQCLLLLLRERGRQQCPGHPEQNHAGE